MTDRLSPALYTARDPAISQTLLDHVQEYNVGFIGSEALSAASGGAQTRVVITMYPESLPGHFVRTFFNDWYERIHFIPVTLELGNLISDQSRDVLVWNAYLSDIAFTSFALTNGDGIAVTEPAATPFNALPLSISTYIVTVQTEGPPTILATMQWVIGGESYSVPITGRRTVVWPFEPNWSSPVDETLEWLTYIESSFDRTEQRFAGRADPRRIIEYNAQIVYTSSQLYENIMFGWSNRLFAVPLWQEKSLLGSAVIAGDTVVLVNTENRSFVPGSLLVILSSPTSYEAAEIDSVASGSVVLKKGLDRSWPAGTPVFPSMVGRMEQANSARRVAEDKIEAPVRFIGSPAETDARIPSVAAGVTEGGVEVFTEGTNWGSPMSVNYESDFNVIDSDKGTFSLRQRSEWPLVTRGHEWLLESADEATQLRAFFGRRRGRLVPAWIPSATIDFTLVEPVVVTDAVITVTNNDYGQFVNKHPARRNVLIQLRGGVNLLREIDSYTDNGDGTALLGLTTSVGLNIQPSQVRRISFIGLYRMASDAVTFSWKTGEVAVVQTSFALTRPDQ